MAHVDRRLDLADPQARYFCLLCGAAYAREVDGCATCGAESLTTHERILELLRSAAPDLDLDKLRSEPLGALSHGERREHLSEILEALWREGVPFLLADERGNALEPDAADAAELLAPPRHLQHVMREIVMGKPPDSIDLTGGEPPAPGGRTVKLISCASPYQAQLVQAQLDEAGIPYQVNRMVQQFAMSVGRMAFVDIYVMESDLEQAQRTITLEELETGETASSASD
jgi:hypothetical protein